MIRLQLDSDLPNVDKTKVVNGEHRNAFVAVPDENNKGYYALVFGELSTFELCNMISALRSTANTLEKQVISKTKGNPAAGIALANALQKPGEMKVVFSSDTQACPKCYTELLGTIDYKLRCPQCGYERKRK